MSRKDYELIAQGFVQQLAEIQQQYIDPVMARQTLYMLATKLAHAFHAENSRFDHQRFMTACGF